MSAHISSWRISIHAAREGGDMTCTMTDTIYKIFQSTPPVKAATDSSRLSAFTRKFQSTPPVKAATGLPMATDEQDGISIHAAREGGDSV